MVLPGVRGKTEPARPVGEGITRFSYSLDILNRYTTLIFLEAEMRPQDRLPSKRALVPFMISLSILLLVSCSSQSNKPNPATPEGRFELAKQEISQGRFDKALDYTTKILRDTPQHELAPSAALMQMTIYGGLAEGCRQISKALMDGRNLTRDVRLKNDFRNTAFDYYRRQKAYALNFLELFEKQYAKMDKTRPVSFQGVYPQTEAAPRIFLEKARKGMPVASEDRLKDEEQELKNGVLTVVTALAGAGEDRPKAKALYAPGMLNVDRADFLFAIAKILHDQDVLFDRLQLNELQNFKMFCERTNTTVNESMDLLKAKGDKAKLEAATQLKKDCENMMKTYKKS